jgi:geranylgeranyl diphosphate synthase type II
MTSTVDATGVETTLDWYGELTRTAIVDFMADVRRRTPPLADLIADYPLRPAKAIRPSLMLAACQAFGGSLRDAMGPAVSIEMLHNAFLIHDDIEDGSDLRRGRSTMHRLQGVPIAINVGDALAMMALQPLRDRAVLGARMQDRVMSEYLSMAQRTVEGQAQELAWRRHNVVALAPDDYLALIGLKTCWYTTIYPLRVGALIGSRATAQLDALTRFGFHLGAAFQIRDDLLDLDESAENFGKVPLGDLREGKRTLMLIHLLASADRGERRWLQSYLATEQEQRTDADVRQVFALMIERGSIDFAVSYAEGIATQARGVFAAAFAEAPPSEHKEFLRAMTGYMVERRH